MMLEIRDVKKSFGGLTVLDGISLDVEKGDVVAILGPSGSGKTTFLRCLNYLETADSGSLVFDGEKFDLHSTGKKDIARMRRKTAFVFQNYNLFLNKTVLQNVTLGLTSGMGMDKQKRRLLPWKCWKKWVWRLNCRIIPTSCLADSSSGWQSLGQWRQVLKSSTLMSLPAHWILN